jgi:succinoglycan biosynthesis protein ExoA
MRVGVEALECHKIIVSVIMPIRNEEKYIERCIETLLKQDFPKKNLEIILVDGCSNDQTKTIIERYINNYPSLIKLIDNPNKTVQYALNIGINAAQGVYIVRLDAHSEYSNDYISKCVYYLEKTGAINVGGPMIAKGRTQIQKIIAASYHSAFALGGGRFHVENFEGFADTVYLGAFQRANIIKLGMYDERFPRSEDDELNYRIKKNGGTIYITKDIKSVYYPRDSFKKLFFQYFEYGFWKVAVIKKHRIPARITHLIPGAFVLFNIVSIPLLFLSSPIALLYSVVMGIYVLLGLYYSITNKYIAGSYNRLLLFLTHLLLHFSYGIGFISGIYKIKRFKLD